MLFPFENELLATPKSTPTSSRAHCTDFLVRCSDPNRQANLGQEQGRVGAAVHKTRINFSAASSRFLSLSLHLSLLLPPSPFMLPFCFHRTLPLPLPITHMRSFELPRIASFHSFGFSDLIYFICFVWHPQVLPQWYINFVGVSSSQKRRHAAPLILNEQERAANFRRYIYVYSHVADNGEWGQEWLIKWAP